MQVAYIASAVADLHDRRPPNSSACRDTNSRTLIAGRPVTRSTPSANRSYRPARFNSAIVTRWWVKFEEQAGHGSPHRPELTGRPGDQDRCAISHATYFPFRRTRDYPTGEIWATSRHREEAQPTAELSELPNCESSIYAAGLPQCLVRPQELSLASSD